MKCYLWWYIISVSVYETVFDISELRLYLFPANCTPVGLHVYYDTVRSFFKDISLVLHWIYGPTRIEEDYLLLNVWTQRNLIIH